MLCKLYSADAPHESIPCQCSSGQAVFHGCRNTNISAQPEPKGWLKSNVSFFSIFLSFIIPTKHFLVSTTKFPSALINCKGHAKNLTKHFLLKIVGKVRCKRVGMEDEKDQEKEKRYNNVLKSWENKEDSYFQRIEIIRKRIANNAKTYRAMRFCIGGNICYSRNTKTKIRLDIMNPLQSSNCTIPVKNNLRSNRNDSKDGQRYRYFSDRSVEWI